MSKLVIAYALAWVAVLVEPNRDYPPVVQIVSGEGAK